MTQPTRIRHKALPILVCSLLGLLCLKASRAGFCSDQDVRARALGEAGAAAVGGMGIS